MPERQQFPAASAPNMTSFGRYGGQNTHMMNIELARILQDEREREIELALRARRILRPTETREAMTPAPRTIRRTQRPASTGAAAR
jgi:hypothetical protein